MLDHHLPVSTSDGHLVGFTKFPVQMVVDVLLCGASFQSGQEGQSIKVVIRSSFVKARGVMETNGLT